MYVGIATLIDTITKNWNLQDIIRWTNQKIDQDSVQITFSSFYIQKVVNKHKLVALDIFKENYKVDNLKLIIEVQKMKLL